MRLETEGFVKTRWNGLIDMVHFTKWYEPILAYTFQIMFGLLQFGMTLVPFWGAKLMTLQYYEGVAFAEKHLKNHCSYCLRYRGEKE